MRQNFLATVETYVAGHMVIAAEAWRELSPAQKAAVCRQGPLKGAQEEDHAPALPEDYAKGAKTIAEPQAALAGYRLADEIAKCLAVN